MKKSHLILAFLFSFAFFQSCQKDDTLNNGGTNTTIPTVAPQLPPQATFAMPLSAFEDLDTLTSEAADTRGPESYENWFVAGTNLVIWSTVINVATVIPFAAYAEAFNHTPTHSNGVYTWAYDFAHGTDNYTFTLTGEYVNPNQVQWIMKASLDGGFQDVEWFTGLVAITHTEGSWKLNHELEPSLSIEYAKQPDNEDFQIRYSNINPTSDDNGDYIEFKVQSTSDFDRAYNVFRTVENNLLNIEWKEDTKMGRVKNQKHFNDTEWHCWGEDKKNMTCQ